MTKTLFIYNPNAGKGLLRAKLSEVIEILSGNELEITVFPTKKMGDAREMVERQGEKYERIICSGGDGTLHEVVNGLMHLPESSRPACGYIPTGTVNDFASGIRIPKQILKAAEIASGKYAHAYDVGEMNGDYFTYVAAFGAFTSVSYETPQATKNLLGKTAYILDGVTKLNTIKSIPVHVNIDGEEWEQDCILGMVTNAETIGGLSLYRKTKVCLDDGCLDGIFVQTPKNPVELNQVMDFLLRGVENSSVRIIHGKRIEITSREEIAYTLDGENGGSYKRTVLENHKQAVTYICDPQ